MTNKINGIDVSECKHLKNDNIKKPLCRSGGCTGVYRSCLCEGNPDCYFKQFKRLQEENEGLKSLNDFNVQKIEVLQEENEKLYKALEEIRKEANRLLYEENPIYGYNNSNYFEILAKYVLAKTNEVLNDRD